MDHLPLPNSSKPYITIPYEAPEKEWYNTRNTTFQSYPSSQGWTDSDLYNPTSSTSSGKTRGNSEIEQFYQTYLFFGLAIDVLHLGGVKATTEDFLRKKGNTKARIVDTSCLPGMLVRWVQGVKARGNARGDWEPLNTMFERVGSILDHFCAIPPTDPGPLEPPKPTWPVRDEISTSIIALAGTLRRAAINAVNEEIGNEIPIDPWPKHARSLILKRRLESKWCVADVTTMLKQLPLDGHYYLSASEGLDSVELDHHASCIPERCLYEYDANMYVTKHAEDDNCPESIAYGGQLGPERGQKDWEDAMIRILEKDAVPVALWVKGLKTLWSVEYHFEGNRRPGFVAVSHVWADSKGNPNANALPQCQLDLIQRFVEKMTWEDRKEVPTDPCLSDGIGFWMDTLCIPVKNDRLRGKAITTMRHVYSQAKAVLVLDDWLQGIRSDAEPLDMIVRIYASNWCKRLWTHQEGFLPEKIWFQFADRAVERYELLDRLREQLRIMQERGIHLSFPMNANLRVLDQYTFFQWAFKDTTKESKWKLYKPLAPVMSERKTSRLADEVICLATIVDIPLDEFLELPSKPDAEAGQERMARFLKALGRFDSGIIFNNYPRLEKKGYRWAPRSLLNHRMAEITYWPKENWTDVNVPFEEMRGQLGLLVKYRGFLVEFANEVPFSSAERGFAVTLLGDESHGQAFIVQLPRNEVQWKNGVYAVIIPEVPGRDKVPAVVGTLESTWLGGIYTVRHDSIASLWQQDSVPPGVHITNESLLEKDTRWLIV